MKNILRPKLTSFTILLFIALLPCVSMADLILVAKANFPLDSVRATDVSAIWLGEKHSFSNLSRIRVVDLEPGNPLYEQFYKEIVGLTGAPLNIYWKKKMFTGKSFRPKQVRSIEDVIRLVTQVPGVIGYIDSSEFTDELKVLRITRHRSQ
jgi:hypothetical protein